MYLDPKKELNPVVPKVVNTCTAKRAVLSPSNVISNQNYIWIQKDLPKRKKEDYAEENYLGELVNTGLNLTEQQCVLVIQEGQWHPGWYQK